ncbi:hypothetical protein [Pseudofrankia sp. DC12]|uniref:hypothetical protein n=1 Tax=Pseudofrankia sp. DC12 TaxID=683315 RepID=UPI0005F86DB9|nr:hypothetical protein [Pseudofrankia sp. DC12]
MLQLWDITDANAPTRIASVDDDKSVNALAFSPDKHTLATTIGGRLRLWDIKQISALSGHVQQWSCYATGGGLSPEEWLAEVPGIAYRRSCP